MKALACLCLIAGVVAADPVTPPKTWTSDPAKASSLASSLRAVPHFAGAQSIVTTEAYRAPAGGALYITRVVANVAADQRDKAATAELDEVRASLVRQGAAAKPNSWAQKANPDTKQLEATLGWVDSAAGIANTSRVVIAADTQIVAAVTGECVLAADAEPELMVACRAALATLDPGVAPASRVPLAIVGESATAGAEAGGSQAISQQPLVPTIGNAPEAPRLGDGGGHPTLAPIQIAPPEPSTDHRPIYVGAGLVVLAAAFWWNRRQREKFEREDRSKEDKQ